MYLRGRLLQRSAGHGEAAQEFGKLAKLESERPEPHLRLADSLRAGGEPARAAKRLREMLEKGVADHELWNRWAALCLADLELRPGEILEDFPRPTRAPAGETDGRGYASDIRWLLDQLRAGSGVRINCGSAEERVDPQGRAWGADRFYRGGRAIKVPALGAAARAGAIYRELRQFARDGLHHGYRLPLLRGSYRVTLLLGDYRASDLRRFDVLLEGDAVLARREVVPAGYATVEKRLFEVSVADGNLDIEFANLETEPKILAIEIAPAP